MVLVLVETHMGGDYAQNLGFINIYHDQTRVEAQGFSGGILVFLKSELVYIDPIEQSSQYITMVINRQGEEPWYFSAIYASPDPSKRQKLWRELSDFAARHDKPWLLDGDFNETRLSWERSLSCRATSIRTSQFNHWVEAHQLLEVEFSGQTHTWSRVTLPKLIEAHDWIGHYAQQIGGCASTKLMSNTCLCFNRIIALFSLTPLASLHSMLSIILLDFKLHG
ncbi:DNA polymerase II large subunit [Bienertia sinuspersici]